MPKAKLLVSAFAFAALFLAAAAAAPAQALYTITGHVMREQADGSRVPVTDAVIDVYCFQSASSRHWRPGTGAAVMAFQRPASECRQRTTKTDDKGRFEVGYGYLSGSNEFVVVASAPGAKSSAFSVTRQMENDLGTDFDFFLKPGDGSRPASPEEARALVKGRASARPLSREERAALDKKGTPEAGASSGGGNGAAVKGVGAAKDTSPPQITITSPRVERGVKLSVQSGEVTVAGRATDKSGVNEVLVQGAPARLDEQGNFSADVLLKVGDNRITVEAADINGNHTRTDFTLRRESPPVAAAPQAPSTETQPGAAGEASPSSGRYYALVIGINDYKFLPHLKTAESDARSVASVLRDRLGFEVNLLLNATRQQIVGALNRYRRELDPSANLVIYYAGHGYFDKAVDKAYWLPVDAALDDNANWISADDVTVNVKGIQARHVLIISDSCYSGTIVRGINPDLTRPSEREQYIRRMLAGTSRTLIASGGNEPVADGGADGHSVFASALLRGFNQTDRDAFTAEELFYNYIREAVSGRSDQTPEYNPLRNSGHESGDFVFVRKK